MAEEAAGLEEATPLPRLREELRFMEAAEDAGRARGFLIYDPLRNSYFRIGQLAAKALASWRAGTAGALMAALERKHGLRVTLDDIGDLLDFVLRNGLTREAQGGWRGLFGQAARSRKGLLPKLLHNYLFFRIPLARPEPFLRAALPYVRWLGSRAGIVMLLLISLTGLYMTGRQWDVFKATFMGFLTLKGLALYALTLVIVKVGHELGHAFIATRFGCRVPSMGIAFLVMMPMLYTDVTDAWKLRSRRARLLIGAGGMLVELGIAGLALFLWAFLPEGPGRAAAYFVATTSLVTTLAINASPFMRFDGYHILADALRMHNMRPRAFALALTRLRNLLFGLKTPPPERLSPRLANFLTLYAAATVIYRLFLFLGIALLVYHAFPKIIGLFLGGVEVTWFLAMPVFREVRQWWRMRMEIIREGRPWRPLIALGLVLAALFAPVWEAVRLPALLTAKQELDLFAPEPARVVRAHLRAGQDVRAGDVLVVLRSRELEHEEKLAREKLRLVESRLRRLAADRADLSAHAVLRKRREALKKQLAGLARRRAGLTLKARFGGVVTHVMRGLRPGLWVNGEYPLGRVVAHGGRVARALVNEEDVARLKPGARGWFVPDDPELPRARVRLAAIGAARRTGRDLSYLSSVHGGPVPAERDREGRIHTRQGVFPARFVLAEGGGADAPCARACTGRIVAQGERRSLAGRMARRAVAVILRESGF